MIPITDPINLDKIPFLVGISRKRYHWIDNVQDSNRETNAQTNENSSGIQNKCKSNQINTLVENDFFFKLASDDLPSISISTVRI